MTDPNGIRAFAERMMQPGDVYEGRIPKPRRNGPARLYAAMVGYFDNPEAFAQAVSPLNGPDAIGIYMTLNPVHKALLARADNRLVKAETTAGDSHIARRSHLLVDCDPVRQPKDVSATDQEVARAVERCGRVLDFLRGEMGWPDPLADTMSGNGRSLIYAIDLPNDAPSTQLIRRVLAALDYLFSDDYVTVDPTNFNASRLTKLVGTVAAKGENFMGRPDVAPRPWRLSTATYPAEPGVVSRAQLEALATLAPQEEAMAEAPRPNEQHTASVRRWTVDQLLAENGLSARPKVQSYGTVYQLDQCLTSTDHADGATIIEMKSGAIQYRCLHQSCLGKDWQHIRDTGAISVPGTDKAKSNGHTLPKDTHKTQANAPQESDSTSGPQLITVRLSDVKPKPISWFWSGRIAFGKLTLLAGDPGLGKSLISLYIAACLSTGTPLPGMDAPPEIASTLILCAEDDLEDTVRPRLDTLNADVERIEAVSGVKVGSGERLPRLDADLALLEAKIAETGARLVIVDPINAYLSGTDGHKDIELRAVLSPLTALAARTGAAVLAVTHLTKGSDATPLHRVMGSLAYVAAARSVLAVAKDPDQPGRCVFVQIKSNLAALAPGLGYSAKDTGIIWHKEAPTADVATLFGAAPLASGNMSALKEAKDFLRQALGAGSRPAKEVQEHAQALDISGATLRRAREDLKLSVEHIGFGTESAWYWSLPTGDKPQPPDDPPSTPDTTHGGGEDIQSERRSSDTSPETMNTLASIEHLWPKDAHVPQRRSPSRSQEVLNIFDDDAPAPDCSSCDAPPAGDPTESRSLPAIFVATNPNEPLPTAPCRTCGGTRWRIQSDEGADRWRWHCCHCHPLTIINPDGSRWPV